MLPQKLTLSFDIGHASIGWSVFRVSETFPEPLGAGTVLFPKDSCLASARREFRRSRRNIAAKRSRVAHLKNYLETLGILTKAQLNENANSYPWFLAARVLASVGSEKLSWQELWTVLRWYAHNRGYDGNALWAGDSLDNEEEIGEDTQKVNAARALMEKHGTTSMAETFCAVLGLNPLGDKKASRVYFKGNNAAFPRNVVEAEVRKILSAHIGVLPKLDEAFIDTLVKAVPENITFALKLPARFSDKGGLLFGQYVPRFDNRIIGKCRITGKNVPLKSCREYLLYRWGRLINNLTVFGVDGTVRVLLPREREALHAKMQEAGFFDKKSINAALEEVSGCKPANTESYFLTEEMEEALVLDPVKKLLSKKTYIKDLWKYFSDRGKKIFAAKLARGETLKLSACIEQMNTWGNWQGEAQFHAVLETLQNAENKKKAGKRRNLKNLKFKADFPSGRASYCREILRKTFEEALAGTDSTQSGGCLYETDEIRERLLGRVEQDIAADSTEKWIASQTNNHMVRHRLLIFSRLLEDIVNEYADGNAENIGDVIIEVVRDLREFSGMNSKEIAAKLSEKNANFSSVSKKLEDAADDAGIVVNGSLIRKARLLEDQNFTCPYTGQKIDYPHLFGGILDIEHIIPRSLRPSDALSSCVMTFRAVNDLKGQRTAMQFMKEFAGKDVPGLNIQIQPLKNFTEWVDAHKKQKLRKGFSKEDQARCRRRAELLLLERYDERNADFTERDLTQTSHLNKMAIRLVKRNLNIDAWHLAGAITGFVRKNLNIDECLVAAVPRMQHVARVGDNDSRKLTKSEMRELSHLHHAMDAVTQGLTGIFFRTEDWKLLAKRNLTERERLILHAKYEHLLDFSESGKIKMKELPEFLTNAISARLKECRVVQHVPAKMHGMSVEQTTWSIKGAERKDNKVSLSQHTTGPKQERLDSSGKRFVKFGSEKPSLLLGYNVPAEKKSKLKNIKGVMKICENWGCALDPEPVVIPHFKVFPKLRELRERNGGNPVRILRRGQQIEVLSGNYKGVWVVVSIKDNAGGIALDLNSLDKIKIENKTNESKINVILKSLLRAGIKILKPRYTGTPCPTM